MRALRRPLLAAVACAFASLLWLPSGGTSAATSQSRTPAAVASTSFPWVYPRAGLGTGPVEPGVLQPPDHSIQPPSWIPIG